MTGIEEEETPHADRHNLEKEVAGRIASGGGELLEAMKKEFQSFTVNIDSNLGKLKVDVQAINMTGMTSRKARNYQGILFVGHSR